MRKFELIYSWYFWQRRYNSFNCWWIRQL